MGTASSKYRSWVSPITAGCFIALGISGLMMMFHLRIGALHSMHECVGILFCIAGVFHLVMNWRSMLGYLRTKGGIVAATAIILLVASLWMGREEGRGGPHGQRGVHSQQQGGPGIQGES